MTFRHKGVLLIFVNELLDIYSPYLQPLCLTPTPMASKSSSTATKRTIQLRNKFIRNQIETSSKDLEVQTGFFVRSFGVDERRTILKEAGISQASIGAKEMVAMKSNLGLPWERMKALNR